MASGQPLLPEEPAPSLKEKAREGVKKGCKGLGLVLLGLYVIAIIVQACIYAVVTTGCGPKMIGEDYSYPGGGKSEYGDATFNLVPERALLIESEHTMWGWPMNVFPASEAAGTTDGANTGTWFRNTGPLFYIYCYEDIANSKITMYMRSNFWLPWVSYKIARCDGKGPTVTFSEYGHWMSNKVRAIFRTNQRHQYSVYLDGEMAAEVQDIDSSVESLTFTNTTVKGGKQSASSVLKGIDHHGKHNEWLIINKRAATNSMPYWVANAVTVPFAYTRAAKDQAAEEAKFGTPAPSSHHSGPTLLLSSQASEPAFYSQV